MEAVQRALQRLVRPLGLWLLFLVLVMTGFARTLDNRFYDLVAELRGVRATEHLVLIVAVDEESLRQLGPLPWSGETLESLFAPILASGAPVVGSTISHDRLFPRDEELPANLADALSSQRLVLPRRLALGDGNGPPEALLGDFGGRPPELFRGAASGVLVVRPDADGRVRRHPVRLETTAGLQRSLEAVLLEAAGSTAPVDPIPISWVGPPGSVARVSAYKVVRGEMQSDVFDGRVVLLGLTDPSIARTVATPVSLGGLPMSEVELHANVLATVLDGVVPAEAPWWSLLLLLLLLVLVDVGARRGDMRFNLAAVGLSTALLLVGAGLLYVRIGVQLWPSLLALAILVPPVAEQAARQLRGQARLGRLLVELSRARSYLDGDDTVDVQHFWVQLADFAARFSGVEVAGVAERVGSGLRFTWRAASGLSVDELRLEPRFLRRAATNRAVRDGRPAVLSGAAWSEQRDLLAVPLVVSDRVRGLVVLLDAEPARRLRIEAPRLVSLGATTGRLIDQFRMTKGDRRGLGRGALWSGGLDRQIDTVGTLTRLMMDEQVQWRGLLRSLPLGVLFADMMGEVQFGNDRIRTLLKRSGLSWRAELDLTEVLAKLTARTPADISAALFLSFRSPDPTQFRWETQGAVPRTFRARVLPVVREGAVQDDPEMAAEGALGYLCTVEDVTQQRESQRARSAAVEALGYRARAYLEALQTLGDGLALRSDVPADVVIEVGRVVAQSRTLTSLLGDFGRDDDRSGGVRAPEDLALLVRTVGQRLDEKLHVGDRIAVRTPRSTVPVNIDRRAVGRLVYQLVVDSMANSPAGSVTHVEVVERRDALYIEVHDAGFGIPGAVLAHLESLDLDAADLPDSGLPRIARDAHDCGARLHITSRVGEGTRYRLSFPVDPAMRLDATGEDLMDSSLSGEVRYGH